MGICRCASTGGCHVAWVVGDDAGSAKSVGPEKEADEGNEVVVRRRSTMLAGKGVASVTSKWSTGSYTGMSVSFLVKT